MAKVTNKNSRSYHTSRSKAKLSKAATSQRNSRRIFFFAKRSILVVIVLAMLTVILMLLLMIFSNPERVVKNKIEAIATDYYENYFYPQITEDNPASLPEIMERYELPGFALVTLRQLLLYDDERNANSAKILSNYCNENATYIQIFPESPYSKTDYHINYHYSCAF